MERDIFEPGSLSRAPPSRSARVARVLGPYPERNLFTESERAFSAQKLLPREAHGES